MQLHPEHEDCLYHFVHWSHVGAGAPWQHTACWHGAPTDPAPAEPDRIAARRVVQITGGDNWLVALCNDGTLLQLAKGAWTQLPAIPQP